MRCNLLITIILPVLAPFLYRKQHVAVSDLSPLTATIRKVSDIPLPEGYKRIPANDSSFAGWLRNITVKSDHHVYLYNGQLKQNQDAQYVVLDISVGKKDLQQCADAVMRMRADYLYHYHRYHEISFSDNNGKKYACPNSPSRAAFDKYLERVYMYCGTLSLDKQLRRVADFNSIVPGDVLIKGGSPGHAVTVMDVAVNSSGRKIYLLAQSYMPAQDIHILKNPMNEALSPWYEADAKILIYSPEWTFTPQQLKRW